MLHVIIISVVTTSRMFTRQQTAERIGFPSTITFQKTEALIQWQKITLIKIYYSWELSSVFTFLMMAEKNG